MDIDNFPLIVKNNLETWLTIGKVWIPPLGCVSVSEMVYKQNEQEFKYAFETKRVSVPSESSDDEGTTPPDTDDASKESVEEEDAEVSVIERFVNGDLHWRTAQKEIRGIDDIEQIDELLVEAKHYQLSEESAVFRALSERFNELVDSL